MVKTRIWQWVSKGWEKYYESNRVKKKKFQDHYVKQIAVETIKTKKSEKDERGERNYIKVPLNLHRNPSKFLKNP